MAQATGSRRRRRGGRTVLWIVFAAAVVLAAAGIGMAVRYYSAEPVLTLKGDAEMTVDYESAFSDPGVSVTLHGEDISGEAQVTGNVDTSLLGETELTYSVEFAGKTWSVTRSVQVVDTEAPVLTLNGDAEVAVEDISAYQDAGAAASDNADGDLTASVTSELIQTGDYTWQMTYTVADSSGNTATAARTITELDTTNPIIILNGEDSVTVQVGDTYTDAGATAKDNRDGDLTDKLETSGSVDTSTPGTYKISYYVEDAAGNAAGAWRTVTVKAKSTENRNQNNSNNSNSDNTGTGGGGGKSGSLIYLTFDDGPSSDVTPRILDILKENGVKATFFIVNYSDDKKDIIQRMIDEGHTVGIHGYSHDYATIYASTDAYMQNITKLHDKLYDDFGYDAWITRFPGGSSNTISRHYCTGIMSALVNLLPNAGYEYLDWNVDSGDADGKTKDEDYILGNVKSRLMEGCTNVVLMHDLSTKYTTADALQEIIDYGKENGYTFCAASKDMTQVHHHVNN